MDIIISRRESAVAQMKELKYRKENRKETDILIISLSIMVILVITLCVSYVKKLDESIRAETNSYLKDVSESVSAVVADKINATYKNLETIGKSYGMLQESDRLDFLNIMREQYGYLRIGIVDDGGTVYTSDGYQIDLNEEPCIQEALQGSDSASDLLQSSVDGQPTIIFAVPIYEDGKVKGALAASASQSQMKEFLNISIFDSDGYSQIINSSGEFMIRSDRQDIPDSETDFFAFMETYASTEQASDLKDMKQDMSSHDSGNIYYNLYDGPMKALTYVPLGFKDWYLISTVPIKAAQEQLEGFSALAIGTNFSIALLFIILIIGIIRWNQRSHRKLERIAYADPVTGGYNRNRFGEKTQKLIERAAPNTYALVSLDINHFKLINDTFGTSEGDKTLKYMYEVIWEHLREGEIAARITGDTFNILLYNDTQEEIRKKLEAITVHLNEYNGMIRKKYYLTITAGVYVVDQQDMHLYTIRDRANVARRKKKQETGDLLICSFYDDEERIKMLHENEITNRMKEALEQHEFQVYLQPKVALESRRVEGAEALVRWNSPERGLISPGDFIPVFEKNGFIINLDLFVFEEVCRLQKKWIEEGRGVLPISVNVSRVHLQNPEFLKDYQKIFEKYELPHGLLEIELTETAVYENLGKLKQMIKTMHEMGFGCSLDDFGSGYSSLNMLREVPVDVLKLDKAFFDTNLEKDERGMRVVESILELAGKLHMSTVSEGVESQSQVEILTRAGCDMVQGFVFYKPLSVSQYEKLIFGKGKSS